MVPLIDRRQLFSSPTGLLTGLASASFTTDKFSVLSSIHSASATLTTLTLTACNLMSTTPLWAVDAQEVIRDTGSLIGQGISTTATGLYLVNKFPSSSLFSFFILPFALNIGLGYLKDLDFIASDLTYKNPENSTWALHATTLVTLYFLFKSVSSSPTT